MNALTTSRPTFSFIHSFIHSFILALSFHFKLSFQFCNCLNWCIYVLPQVLFFLLFSPAAVRTFDWSLYGPSTYWKWFKQYFFLLFYYYTGLNEWMRHDTRRLVTAGVVGLNSYRLFFTFSPFHKFTTRRLINAINGTLKNHIFLFWLKRSWVDTILRKTIVRPLYKNNRCQINFLIAICKMTSAQN